jgi:hypothetical protein
MTRCATGESWQEIMRGCLAGAECEPKEKEKLISSPNPQLVRYAFLSQKDKKCGLDFAYAYFSSFIFLSTFLV